MAQPLRFRRSHEGWNSDRVDARIYSDLDDNLGAESASPWFKPPADYEARRFDMDNGDTALFCWDADGAWWMGNTETPKVLWQTNKQSFSEAPYPVTRWAQRELLAQLHDEDPWLADYPYVSWFFLPVFLSKDGRETTRTFFAEEAAGFPDADPADALAFYEEVLRTVPLDADRHIMAGKLGSSEYLDMARANGAMGEFDVAWLLTEAGYDITPEIEVTTGHFLDFRADCDGEQGVLAEVTRPVPTNDRAAGTPIAAVKDTAQTKTSGQLDAHAGGVVLFVDCTSFPDDDWASILAEQPEVHHRPAAVFRIRPDGSVEGYTKGAVPLDLPQF